MNQPVHTVYGGAHLFRPGIAAKLGGIALGMLDEHGSEFGEVFRIPDEIAVTVQHRVWAKLRADPVEDYRVDFEDGYGPHTDDEEDDAAEAVAAAMAEGPLPPMVGIRTKPLSPPLRDRAVRTVEIVVSRLAQTGLPAGFAVTLPKVDEPEQAAHLDAVLGDLEDRLDLKPDSIATEVMLETPGVDVRAVVAAAGSRCRACHLGPYDYTAALGIVAAHQGPTHDAAAFARFAMQAALAGSGVWVGGGPLNILPVGDRASVYHGWRTHYDHVRRLLRDGYYQSWDVHPGQLVSRYAAVYSFFLESMDAAAERLRNFVAAQSRATTVGAVFDDEASGRGLRNFFDRAVDSGAITTAEAEEATGVDFG